MITASGIKEKSGKIYPKYLQKIIAGIPFERIVVKCNKEPSDDFATYQNELKDICDASKEKKGYGYTISWRTVKHKLLGKQDLPKEIYFETEKDFLKFIRKETEVQQFRKDIASILAAFPVLTDWLMKHPLMVVDNSHQWADLLKVLTYFSQNPRPNMYIRELPINVHTKFIERNEGILSELLDIVIADYVNVEGKEFEECFSLKSVEPLVRVRFLDDELSYRYGIGFKDISLPVSEFDVLDWEVGFVFVVENEVNFLTFPPVKNSIIIWGSGYGVSKLKNIPFLHNARLYYWGDLDAQGFEILSQFRGYFPQTQSLLMDNETFELFFENDEGKPSKVSVDLNLDVAEQMVYEKLKINNWRLEQEKIPQSYVMEYVGKIFA